MLTICHTSRQHHRPATYNFLFSFMQFPLPVDWLVLLISPALQAHATAIDPPRVRRVDTSTTSNPNEATRSMLEESKLPFHRFLPNGSPTVAEVANCGIDEAARGPLVPKRAIVVAEGESPLIQASRSPGSIWRSPQDSRRLVVTRNTLETKRITDEGRWTSTLPWQPRIPSALPRHERESEPLWSMGMAGGWS